jgi:hypothetical protein
LASKADSKHTPLIKILASVSRPESIGGAGMISGPESGAGAVGVGNLSVVRTHPALSKIMQTNTAK